MPQSSSSGATTIIEADAFQWGTKTANRLTANFASDLLLNNAVFGDLADVGWAVGGTPTAPQVGTTASSGDLDAIDDPGQQFITLGSNLDYVASPKVVGGRAILDDIEFHTGTRPTKVTVRVKSALSATTDAADTTGVGIGRDADEIISTATEGNNYMICAGATNFELHDGNTATDLGVAVDTSVHNFDIEITLSGATYRVLIDGTERKAAAALVQDKWPMLVRAYRGASGGNPQVYGFGVKYE